MIPEGVFSPPDPPGSAPGKIHKNMKIFSYPVSENQQSSLIYFLITHSFSIVVQGQADPGFFERRSEF